MRSSPSPLLRGLAALALAPLLAGCIAFHKKPIQISSDPPGARVLVDGRDTGFSTPCLIRLEREEQTLALELEGYRTAARRLVPDSHTDTVYWREMSVEYRTWRFPLWLNRDDAFIPWHVDRSLRPNRVHVRLRRAADVD
jgi:hypothetical protein